MKKLIPSEGSHLILWCLGCLLSAVAGQGAEIPELRGSNPPESVVQALEGKQFTFARIGYQSVRREPLGHGWNGDYPDADVNLSLFVEAYTPINVPRTADGDELEHVVLRFTDPQLRNYPLVYLTDAGTVGLEEGELRGLQTYLLSGGMLHVDDFWGSHAWQHWEDEIRKILPSDKYPIRDIPLNHELFHCFFDIREVKQVPSIQFWRRFGGKTSERGSETAEPHVRGLFDQDGRLLIVMTHNTDLGDGWESYGEDREYSAEFSIQWAVPFGINIVVYALTR